MEEFDKAVDDWDAVADIVPKVHDSNNTTFSKSHVNGRKAIFKMQFFWQS